MQIVPRNLRNVVVRNKQRPAAECPCVAIPILPMKNVVQLTGIRKGHIVKRLVRQCFVSGRKVPDFTSGEIKVIRLFFFELGKGSLIQRSRSSQRHLCRSRKQARPVCAVRRQRPRPEVCPVFIEQRQLRAIRRIQKPVHLRHPAEKRQLSTGKLYRAGTAIQHPKALQRHLAAGLLIEYARVKVCCIQLRLDMQATVSLDRKTVHGQCV